MFAEHAALTPADRDAIATVLAAAQTAGQDLAGQADAVLCTVNALLAHRSPVPGVPLPTLGDTEAQTEADQALADDR